MGDERVGKDNTYQLDSSEKIRGAKLAGKTELEEGIRKTIKWMKDNLASLKNIKSVNTYTNLEREKWDKKLIYLKIIQKQNEIYLKDQHKRLITIEKLRVNLIENFLMGKESMVMVGFPTIQNFGNLLSQT